ncbi:MAG: DUF1232 domain-containing protein [Fibrobacter sp.]|jgi:hypothetical protein|nr:DUF1232 domain-containing protein [Fibrobacter sp.]MBQ3778345.1 DUF1232 domain-containing protein [Fibrobacter sp.]
MRKGKVFEDVEVHDMSEMDKRSDRRNKGAEKEQNGVSVVWKALSVLIAMVALAYDMSPIDAVPDALPVLGWLDDFGFTAMAALNLYQQFAKDQGALTVRLAKYLKWMLIALVVIAGVAVGGLVALIVKLVTQ